MGTGKRELSKRVTTSIDTGPPIYEQIGKGYAQSRRADRRWQARIHSKIEGYDSLLNVGAGTGSYEPSFMRVVAVEPSRQMIRQRPQGSAPVVCATAEHLPFANAAFDVALAVLTTHHWFDAQAGLSEMRRVAHSQVVVTWDPAVFAQRFWLLRDYLPEIEQHEQQLATLDTVVDSFVDAEVTTLPVPADCVDGVLGAYWRRPEAYLSASIRSAMSGIALINPQTVAIAMERLQADLASGVWRSRNAQLLELEELDLGYRLVCSKQGTLAT